MLCKPYGQLNFIFFQARMTTLTTLFSLCIEDLLLLLLFPKKTPSISYKCIEELEQWLPSL